MTTAADFAAKITVGDANLDRLDSAVNDAAGVWTTKDDVTVDNLRKRLDAMGYYAPKAFVTGLAVNDPRFTVTYLGDLYAADPESVPFTTTGTFAPSEWRILSSDDPRWYNERNAVNAGAAAALTQGDKIVMGGHEYTVETGGSATDDLGVSGLSSGFISKNQWVLSAEAWGVTPDATDGATATANGTILRAMSLELIENRQKGEIVMPPGGKVHADRPVILGPDGTILNMSAGAWLHNPRPNTDFLTGQGDLSTTCFTAGSKARGDMDDDNEAGFVATGAIVKGENTVTVSNPGDFEIGDGISVIDAPDTLGLPVANPAVPGVSVGPPGPQPLRENVTLVVGKSGSVLEVRDAWTFDAAAGSGTLGASNTAGAWIANFSYRTNSANTTAGGVTLETGRWMAREPQVWGGIFSNAWGPLFARQCATDALFDGIEFRESEYGFAFNCLVNSIVRGGRFDFDIRAFEGKTGARNTKLLDPIFTWRSTGATIEDALGFGEAAEGIEIIRGVLDLADGAHTSAINFSGINHRCSVVGMEVRGKGANLNTGIQISSTTENARVSGMRFDIGSYDNYPVVFDGTDNVVEATHFGGSLAAASGSFRVKADTVRGAIRNNTLEDEGPVTVEAGVTGRPQITGNTGVTGVEGEPFLVTARDNDGATWQSLDEFGREQDLGSTGEDVTSASAVTVGDVITAPAGSLQIGDVITVSVIGDKSADAGDIEVSLTCNAKVVQPFDWTMLASCRSFTYTCEFRVTSASRIAYHAAGGDLTNGTTEGEVFREFTLDIATHDLVAAVKASMTGGTMTVRRIVASRKRRGMTD